MFRRLVKNENYVIYIMTGSKTLLSRNLSDN